MTWTNIDGGDHEGDNWTPSDGTVVGGIHYNIDTFTVTTGYTIYVGASSADYGTTYDVLHIYANTISIVGTIQGDYRGYGGGAEAATGTGPGGGSGSASYSGGGAGYGGHGGAATAGGGGGNSYGVSDSAYIQRGSGGGGGGTGSGTRKGGNGGAGIGLYANTITISGTITCNGQVGRTSEAKGGGGGSGGGIFICGGVITVSGTLSCNGGNGADGGSYDGGRGAGGRVKIMYDTLSTMGSTITVAYATFGGSSGVTNGTSTNTLIGQCTASRSFGQTFTYGNKGVLSKVGLWVNTVNTAGDFTMKVWDDTLKTTELATKTVTISATGLVEFTLSAWESILKNDEYYIELNPDTTGDIELGVYGSALDTTGYYYEDGFIVSYFSVYFVLTGIKQVEDVIIYNTADIHTKLEATNLMLIGAAYEIGTDGLGSVVYADDFTTAKHEADVHASSGMTHDTSNDEMDIADGGYVYYLVDTKYPITGIPILTAQIDITAGIPTIQISTDGSTWYDIDTALVDDVDTEYELDNTASLSLKGNTTFYFRIDCGGGGTVTCSVKSFALDVDIVTMDAEHPVVNTGAANTFRCDQDSDSGMNCEVTLTYKDRKWAA